jgi:surface protein
MRIQLHVILLFLAVLVHLHASDYNYDYAFIITVKTDNPGSSADNQFTIPTHPESSYRYSVDCDFDGFFDAVSLTGDYNCTYPSGSPTSRAIAISGQFPRIYFNNEGDAQKITTVEQWGAHQWESMEDAFFGCRNLEYVPDTPAPDLFSVNSLSGMFNTASKFNAAIGSWDVSSVSSMTDMFKNAVTFNQDLSDWNMSNVSSISGMFSSARSFNQDIGNWDVSNVTNMSGTFVDAETFNQDIGNWDVSDVTWMLKMFWLADAFRQDLSNWNIENVANIQSMFLESNISTSDYDHLLEQWSRQTVNHGLSFDAGAASYCLGTSGKERLENDFGWTISDGGQNCDFYIDTPYEISVKSEEYHLLRAEPARKVAQLSVHSIGMESASYSIVGGSDKNFFRVMPEPGDKTGLYMVYTQADNPLDSNKDNIYRVRVKAESGLYSDERTIRVKVVNPLNPALLMYLLN